MIISHKSPTAAPRINEERAKAIAGGFTWAPKTATFQTRPEDITLVSGRVGKINAKLALGEEVPDFLWRDIDDVNHSFTYQEFLRFAIEMDEWVEAQYIDSWIKKEAL